MAAPPPAFAADFLDGAADSGVFHVDLNRTKSLNALSPAFWTQFRALFETRVRTDDRIRVVLLSSSAPAFTAGLDLTSPPPELMDTSIKDPARRAVRLLRMVQDLQATFTAMEACNKPVVAAVHGACIGAGVDLITACDIRLCSQDAWFSVKILRGPVASGHSRCLERGMFLTPMLRVINLRRSHGTREHSAHDEVDVGLAADVGTLQRLPRVVGNDSLIREWAYTGRTVRAAEAARAGLVSQVFDTPAAMMGYARELAASIASKSPLAVLGTKMSLNYSRGRPVAEGLDHIAMWNAAALQSADIGISVKAALTKTKPLYPKL